jgi:hypothetical protein
MEGGKHKKQNSRASAFRFSVDGSQTGADRRYVSAAAPSGDHPSIGKRRLPPGGFLTLWGFGPVVVTVRLKAAVAAG